MLKKLQPIESLSPFLLKVSDNACDKCMAQIQKNSHLKKMSPAWFTDISKRPLWRRRASLKIHIKGKIITKYVLSGKGALRRN